VNTTGYLIFMGGCFGLAGAIWAVSAIVTVLERRRDVELREGHAETTGTITLHEISQRLIEEGRAGSTLELAYIGPVQQRRAGREYTPPRGYLTPRQLERMVTPDEWKAAWGASNEMGWTLWKNDERWRWRQLLTKFEHDMTWPELVRYGEQLENR
jgi:hypothetical protein